MSYKKICSYCGKSFTSKRSTAKTCSNTCRVYFNKEKKNLKKTGFKTVKKILTVVCNVIKVNENVFIEEEKKLQVTQKKRVSPYYREAECYKCGKTVKVLNKINLRGLKLSCDGCMPFYESCVYAINHNVINSDGLDVHEAYKLLQESNHENHG